MEAFIAEPGNAGYQQNVEKIAQLIGLSPLEAIKKTGMGWIRNGRTKDGLYALTIYLKFQPDDTEVKNVISKTLLKTLK